MRLKQELARLLLVRFMALTFNKVNSEKQLKGFIAKFDPKHQAVIRAARKALRERFPTATELVYDNYNFFVIGYGPTERPSDAVISIAAANGVGLCLHPRSEPSGPGKDSARFWQADSLCPIAFGRDPREA